MRLSPLIILALPIAAAGCGESSSGEGVGGVSATEARALNDAAEMLDKRPAPPALQNVATQAE